MHDGIPPLDAAAIELLLRTIELPKARIAGSVLQDQFEKPARMLVAAKLLVPDGQSHSAAPLGDHDDVPVAISLLPGTGGLGYISSSGKETEVSPERIGYFKADIAAILRRLTTTLVQPGSAPPVALIDNILWETGDARVGSSRNVPLWFARRLADTEWAKIGRVGQERPAPGLRIILTSTPSHRHPRASLPGHLLVSIPAVLKHGAGLVIDQSILKARIENVFRQGDGPVHPSADYGSVSISGKQYVFKGTKQRAIVRHLLQAREAGRPRCLTSTVLMDAGFKDSVNTLAKAFSGREDWKEFMAEADGMSWAFV